MPNIPSIEELLKAGVHFGHRTSRWHPKMAEYIFGARQGVHIIDVEKTHDILENVLEEIKMLIAAGKEIWFIGTKQQNQSIIEKYAIEAKVPFVNRRWLGGTFTNFKEIQKLINEYLDLRDKREKGELKKYTKLEQLQFDRKISELENKIGGISTAAKLPDAIFVVDVRADKTAIVEARKQGIRIYALCDTNVNPDLVDTVIPANDDSIASTSLLTRLVADAVVEGRSAKVAPKPTAKKEVKEEKANDVDLSEDSKASVEELDLELNEKLAKEKEEAEKSAAPKRKK